MINLVLRAKWLQVGKGGGLLKDMEKKGGEELEGGLVGGVGGAGGD